MAWIKRNLFLVLGGVVALALLGVAGYFLYTKIGEERAVTEQLNQSTLELRTLVNRDPHPGTDQVDNISAAKTEHERLEAFLNQVGRHFPYASTNQPTSREFRALLDTTIAELQHSAELAGVQLPDDYWFTFASQKAAMTFDTNALAPLTTQLQDVRALCNILFDAKVIAVDRVRRVAQESESGGLQDANDFLDEKGSTNEWAYIMPYELTFQGFSTELASVLEGLIRSTNCFVLKELGVDRADAAMATDPSLTGYGPSPESPYGPNPYARYGPMMGNPMGGYGARMGPGRMSSELASRYGLGPSMMPPPVAPRPSGRSGNFLEEKVLRITLSINSVKLKPAGGR